MATFTFIQTNDGQQISEGNAGHTATQRFVVQSLDGGTLFEAMSAQGIPPRLAGHPTVPFVFCVEKSGRTLDGSKAIYEIICNYKRPNRSSDRAANDTAKPLIEVGASLTTASTNIDNAELPMEVDRLNFDGTYSHQPVVAQVQVPQVVKKFSRRETTDPTQKAIDYVGKTNDSTWQGGDIDQWICSSVRGVSHDSGESYDVSYEFIKSNNPDGWIHDAQWLENNLPLPSSQPNNPTYIPPEDGRENKQFRVYKTADFSALKLDAQSGPAAGQGFGGFVGV